MESTETPAPVPEAAPPKAAPVPAAAPPRPAPAAPPPQRWGNRALWRLAWPLAIEQLLAVTVGLFATVMVTAVSEAAVSGVSLVDTINQLLITLFSALATGGAVIASQYLGRRDTANASLAARQLIYAVGLVSLAVSALTLVARRPLLLLIYGNLEPAVLSSAEIFLLFSALGFPFLGLYNAGAALFRSMGNSKAGMLVSLLMNAVNIGCSLLFVFAFRWGVAGVAAATLISRATAAGLILWMLVHRRAGPLNLHGLLKFKLVPAMVRRILAIGVPNGLENSMFNVGKLLVSRVVASLGTAVIAGNAIANTVTSFTNIPGNAISLMLLTVVGQCVGAGDYAAARRNTHKLIGVNMGVFALIYSLLMLLAPQVAGLFGLGPEATATTVTCLYIFCVPAVFLWPLSFALPNALRAAGDARYTMVVSILSVWLLRVTLSQVLVVGFGLGIEGVWWAMVADWVVRSIFFILRWRGKKWESKRLIK